MWPPSKQSPIDRESGGAGFIFSSFFSFFRHTVANGECNYGNHSLPFFGGAFFPTLNHRPVEKDSWGTSRYDSRNLSYHCPLFFFIIRTEAYGNEDDNDDKRGKRGEKAKSGRESLRSPNALERKQKCKLIRSGASNIDHHFQNGDVMLVRLQLPKDSPFLAFLCFGQVLYVAMSSRSSSNCCAQHSPWNVFCTA